MLRLAGIFSAVKEIILMGRLIGRDNILIRTCTYFEVRFSSRSKRQKVWLSQACCSTVQFGKFQTLCELKMVWGI